MKQGELPVRSPGAAAKDAMEDRFRQDPLVHDPEYDADRRHPCPTCGMPVGVRWGKLNRHAYTARPGQPQPPRDADGWCLGGGSKAPRRL